MFLFKFNFFLKGKRLGNKVPVMTESGMAYHVMMFINREKTSSEHRIGEEFFWESMASKKVQYNELKQN